MNTFRLPYRNGLVDFSQPTQSQSQSRSNAKAADSADEAENLLQSESFLKRIEAVREQDKRFQLNRDVRINFVEVKQRQTKKAPPVMVHAFQMAKDMGLNVFWIPLEQLDKLLQQSGSHVLILGTFKDDLYRRLVREPRVRIFGPMCVDYCNIRLNQLLPARLISPYTLCMRHTFVTFAGLESKLQNRLVLFVQLMGGHVSRPYRGGITHVIAATQLASKCVMARKESIPIMKSDWVIKLWERSINDSIDAFSASLYRSHRLPIFAGLKICGSQV